MDAKKRSFLSGIPSWALAAMAFAATIMLFIILEFLGDLTNINEDIGEPVFYIIFGLFIAACCYFIVRQDPRSIWYVPVIINVIGIFSAIVEPTFWTTTMWMFICGGWVLSVIASVIGYMVGKRILPGLFHSLIH